MFPEGGAKSTHSDKRENGDDEENDPHPQSNESRSEQE